MKENTERVSNVQKQKVHTINRNQKEYNYDHFDPSNQNERDRTKPCGLVMMQLSEKQQKDKISHTSSYITESGK